MTHRLWRVIGGIVVLALVAGISWFGTQEDGAAPAVVGTSVVIVDPPARATAGTPVGIRWSVQAPVGSTATHTAIHWGSASRLGTFGTDVIPQASGYPNLLPDYASGNFPLPRAFSGALTFAPPGTYFYRAHAMIGGLHYWSPEYNITVE